ncbi:MAG: DUF58 domain-containing protein [Pseudomonadota bacterium]
MNSLLTSRPHHASAASIRDGAESIAETLPALMLEARKMSQTIVAGAHGRRRAGPGETFWQHRPYGYGDPVAAIDWRQSARSSNRLYVRENEWEAAGTLWVWRDQTASLDYASGNETPTKRKRADVLITALAMLASEAGERCGVLGRSAGLYHGRIAPQRILETLCQDYINSDGAASDAPPLEQVRAGSNIVFVSDFYSDPASVEAACAHYAAQGADGVLLQIVDPAEEDFPFSGRTEFEDVETRDRLTFGNANTLARKYRSAFAAHRAALEALAGKTGWRLLTHRTDRPGQSALLSLYTALSDRRSGKGGGLT